MPLPLPVARRESKAYRRRLCLTRWDGPAPLRRRARRRAARVNRTCLRAIEVGRMRGLFEPWFRDGTRARAGIEDTCRIPRRTIPSARLSRQAATTWRDCLPQPPRRLWICIEVGFDSRRKIHPSRDSSRPSEGIVVSAGQVRIKAYGLVEFTKSGYVKTQAVVLTLTVVLLIFALLWQPTGMWAANPVFGFLEWWVLLVLIAEVAETAIMLLKFKEKEAALR